MTKHTDCVITFQKENGDIIMRPRMCKFGLNIGDTTSMGWKVIDIHYHCSDGNYYHEDDYKKISNNYRAKKEPLKKRIKKNIADYLARKTYDWRNI